jgi:hypothetical protein
MRIWGKLIAAAVLPLALSGCLWGPGKFTSDLALRKNGTFVLDYRGEITLQIPDEARGGAEPWSDNMLTCRTKGEDATSEEDGEERPCTAAELAEAKAEHEKKEAERAEKNRKESEEMAKVFGIPGMDEESNRRFAANMMKHQGWRSVSYKGKGVFEVDYHFEGRLSQDFAFPMMPDSDLLVPFIIIRPRNDGSVKVTAPAYVGGAGIFAARAKALSLPNANDGPPSHAQGRFTIITDGEILTNNSEDGPAAAPGGRRVDWDVGAGSDTVPEMLVRL